MKGSAYVVAPIVRVILGIACRIDRSELAKVPRKGPLILVTNHVNFLEAPLLYAFLDPRNIAGFAKADTWRNPKRCRAQNSAIGILHRGIGRIALDKRFRRAQPHCRIARPDHPASECAPLRRIPQAGADLRA